jgi:hypothetical protein
MVAGTTSLFMCHFNLLRFFPCATKACSVFSLKGLLLKPRESGDWDSSMASAARRFGEAPTAREGPGLAIFKVVR